MKLNTTKCLAWAKERGLLDSPDTSKQLQKLASECMAFNDELIKGDLEKAFLEFGDILVTMIIYCKQRGLDFDVVSKQEEAVPTDGLILLIQIGVCSRNEVNFESPKISKFRKEWDLYVLLRTVFSLAPNFNPQRALDAAVEKISNRKTFMINGTAVKEEDFTDNTPLDWAYATDYLFITKDAYEKIGDAGKNGLAAISKLIERYEKGERSSELHKEMLRV